MNRSLFALRVRFAHSNHTLGSVVVVVIALSHMFDDFVLDAIADGKTDFEYDSKLSAQRLLTQFNHEIDAIVQRHGIERTGIAVWYCCGCVSGMIHTLTLYGRKFSSSFAAEIYRLKFANMRLNAKLE